MDLAKLDTAKAANEGFEIEILHPVSGEPVGIRVTLLGRDSDAFRVLQSEQSKRRLNKVAKGGAFKIEGIPAADIDRDTVELLAACTKAWKQVDGEEQKDTLTIDGRELECNRANAILLYGRFAWIREQVDSGVSDRANFIPR